MADMGQIQNQVNTACSRYKEDQKKMQAATSAMSMYQSQMNQAQSELSSIQAEMSSNASEIQRLQYEISNSSDDEGGGNPYAAQRLNLLYQKQQALNMNEDQVSAELGQARAGYSQAQSQYAQAEADLNNTRQYLEAFRTQMIQAADEAQTKVDGFNQSLQILSGASGNMFGGAATSQLGNLQASRNQYQEYLYFAQNIIEQIGSTIDDQGSARVLTLNRSGRETGSYETRFEREMTTQPNRVGEFAPSSPASNASEWEDIMRDPPPFAGGGRHL